MEIVRELLAGCLLIKPNRFEDSRGVFIKTYHDEIFRNFGCNQIIREEFYSVSHKNVVRGMHFQLPPHEHEKIVFCAHGSVLDVLLDLRKGEGYGKVASTELSFENGHIIFIPKGVAHGFMSREDQSIMLYKTSTTHNSASDSGIKWNSFGFDWGGERPIISERDKGHVDFMGFTTPF